MTAEQIRAVAGPVEMYRSTEALRETPAEALPSPGVGIRHYAPRARLVLVDAPLEELGTRLAEVARGHSWGEDWRDACRTAWMFAGGARGVPRIFRGAVVEAPDEMAHELYAGVRALDAAGCTVILCPLPAAEGIGAAIRDRLKKAGT